MNHTRPSNAASVSKADVEKHFGQAANCHVEFDHKANQYLLQGELITETRSEMQLGLTQLVAILLGEQVVQKSKTSWLSWLKR
ncbi:hypothetical protein [Vibrio crassostreae]|nr:hypothetical protein [Vibrio crassostreae]CDT35321.1 conserved hypothetical protein [Vibrio crassostreae]